MSSPGIVIACGGLARSRLRTVPEGRDGSIGLVITVAPEDFIDDAPPPAPIAVYNSLTCIAVSDAGSCTEKSSASTQRRVLREMVNLADSEAVGASEVG